MGLINDNGAISKQELMKRALAEVERVDEKHIRAGIYKYIITLNSIPKFIFLNSKEINYCQVFELTTKNAEKITEHIMGYLKDSSFVVGAAGDFDTTIPLDKIESYDMMDIRDIQITDAGLEMYIGTTFFKLSPSNWIVEEIV